MPMIKTENDNYISWVNAQKVITLFVSSDFMVCNTCHIIGLIYICFLFLGIFPWLTNDLLSQ